MATPIENNTEGLHEILQRAQELPQAVNPDDFVKKTELQDAVDDALEQAKNSGEFDGKDGTSVTHTWNGTTLSVTSASGTSSANLKGDKGDKGDTGSFDESKIVNNFTTTQSGYVADARALKTLDESKQGLELLLRNAAPSGDVAGVTLPFDSKGYDCFYVRYRGHYSEVDSLSSFVFKGMRSPVFSHSAYMLHWRLLEIQENSVIIEDGMTDSYNSATGGSPDNTRCIICEIYGVKKGVF